MTKLYHLNQEYAFHKSQQQLPLLCGGESKY